MKTAIDIRTNGESSYMFDFLTVNKYELEFMGEVIV